LTQNDAAGGGGQDEILFPAVGGEMTRQKSGLSRHVVEI